MSRAVKVRALLFDVFGTVVDWRESVAREGRRFAARHGIKAGTKVKVWAE